MNLDRITKNANWLRDFVWQGTDEEKQIKHNQYIVRMSNYYNKEYKL